MSEKKAQYTKSHTSVTQDGSALKKYQKVIVGRTSFGSFLYFEFCTWLSIVPGAVGLFLRKKFWPCLFGSCGKGVLFSNNVILRQPHRIHLRDNVIISERCILDARTEATDEVIVLGNNVILSNDVSLTCKGGYINIADDVGVGTQTVIHATYGCSVNIGGDCMVGPQCYFIAGGTYKSDQTDLPMRLQGVIDSESGIDIAADVWLGAKVTVLTGTSIGIGAIIGAGAVVTNDVESMAVYVGSPAKKIKNRACNKA